MPSDNDAEGVWRQVYVDVTSLPWMEGGRLCYIDYELDVVRTPGLLAVIEDEDEFQDAVPIYGYTAAFQEQCRRIADEVRQIVDAWTPGSAFDALLGPLMAETLSE